jgi:TolA-binding protein
VKMKSIMRVSIVGLCLAFTVQASPTYSPHKYQQNDWFGEYGENASMYVNPAGIAENDQLEASAGIFRTISGEAGQQYITATMPYDYKHTYGISIFNNGATIEGGERYVENSYMFGYAYRVIHALAIGVDLAVIQVNQFEANKQVSAGIDLGLSWNPISNSKLGHLQVGLALQNALAPTISTEDTDGGFVFATPAVAGSAGDNLYAIPSNANISVFWRGLNRMLEAKAEISIIDVFHDEAEGGSGMNLENSFTFTYYLSHLLGVRARFTKEGYPVLGATVNVKDVNFFKYMELDLEMSHDDIIEKKNRGFIWNIKVTSRFGPTREESIGLRRYQRLKIEPENDYRYAMRLYLNREFLEASYAFGKVITKYPAFHLVDQAAYYKGKSFENMRMHKAATETYNDAIKRYPHSDQRAKYHFQLMNIAYKEGKYADAIIKYQEISQKYADTDVKADADYIAGQIKFTQGNYRECIDLMSPILPGNANYFYARFTMGIAYSRLEQWDESESSFKDVINQTSSNKSERDIQDASKVKLGHLYFSGDTPNLPEAASLYGQVKRDSYVYDEAMLGIAWTFIKVGKPDEALKITKWLTANMKESFLISETYLLEGYCYYMKKDWNNADKALAMAEKLTEKPVISSASVDSANRAFDGMVGEFEDVQIKALDLSKQLPTDRVKMRRDKLRPSVDETNKKIEDHYEFMNRVLQSERFEKNRKRILEDAQFTRAITSTRSTGGDGGGTGLGDLDDLGDLE